MYQQHKASEINQDSRMLGSGSDVRSVDTERNTSGAKTALSTVMSWFNYMCNGVINPI
jgi:hypothetical protein